MLTYSKLPNSIAKGPLPLGLVLENTENSRRLSSLTVGIMLTLPMLFRTAPISMFVYRFEKRDWDRTLICGRDDKRFRHW